MGVPRQPVDWTFIDLFSGCGGLALGFEQAGYKSVFAVDIEEEAAAVYQRNFNHRVHCGDIKDATNLPPAEFIVGGPPCQGFSQLGKMSPSDTRRAEQADLNLLWKEYLRIVDQVQPIGFVIENVPQFLQGKDFPAIRKAISSRGYNYTFAVLNAHDFEVPQRRHRAVLVALKDYAPVLPAPAKARLTVRDAFRGLPGKPNGKNWHIGRNPTEQSLERYKCVPPGGNRFDLMRKRPDITPPCWLNKPTGSTDVFGRLEWDRPSLTVRTEFYKPEKGCYLHPQEHRPITHREAARLQTFPDDFDFFGSKVGVAKMIGNAVPPKLAYHVGMAVRRAIERQIADPREKLLFA